MHQRATLVELSQLDGCEPELFGQIRHGTDRVLVVARQKDDPMAPLDDRIGRQGGRNQVIKSFHELRAGERLRNEGGGQETVQLLRENSKRVHRVDNRLAFPARQGLRNLAMFAERDRQDDCVGLECIPQRLGDDRGSNRPSLRRQRFGRPAARDGPLTGGDCFLLARGTSIVLRDSPRTRPRWSFREIGAKANNNVAHYGGGGAPTTILCGSFSFDRASLKPITQLLPNFILIKAEQASTLALNNK